MNNIIYISSDEETITKKRKLDSPIISKAKRYKIEDKTNIDEKNSQNGSNTSIKDSFSNKYNRSDSSTINFTNKSSVTNVFLSKPGTSKQTDQIEKTSFTTKELNTSNLKQKVIKPQLVVKQKIPIPDPAEDIFGRLIKFCIERKNDEITKKILDNLKKRYEQLDYLDKYDEEFRLLLNGCLQKLSNNSNDKFYSYIQEVHDEIKRRIKKPKVVKHKEKIIKPLNKEGNENENEAESEERKFSKEDTIKIVKLQKAIRKCKKIIMKLETQEVDFDDEEDSTYLQEDRYKRKLIQLCELLSNIVGDKLIKREIYKKKLRRKDIPGDMTGIVLVDEAVISFINSGIEKMNKLKHIKNATAICDYMVMPDYPDILQCINKCNKENNLDLSRQKMECLAKTAFESILRYLKKQRVLESEDYLTSYIENESDGDPAIKNIKLYEKLKESRKEGEKRLAEIFKKYEEKQEKLSAEDLKLQALANSNSEDDSENEFTKKKHETSKSINKGQEKIVNQNQNEKFKINTLEINKNKAKNSDINKETNKNKKIEENKKRQEDEMEQNNKANSIVINKDKKHVTSRDNKIPEKTNDNMNIIKVKREFHEKIKVLTSEISCNESKKASDDVIEILSDVNTPDLNDKNYDNFRLEKSMKVNNLQNDVDPLKLSDEENENFVSKKNESEVNEFYNLNESVKKCTNITEKILEKSRVTIENPLEVVTQVIQSLENTSLPEIISIDGIPSNKKSDKKRSQDKIILNKKSAKDVEIVEVIEEVEKFQVLNKDNKGKKSLDSNDNNDKSNFLKVRSFAKPPNSWKDSLSPEKLKKNFQLPVKKVLESLSKPECVDLTNEKEGRLPSTSTKMINPIAMRKFCIPKNKVVVVKNVISSHNLSLSPVHTQHNKITTPNNIPDIQWRVRQNINNKVTEINSNQRRTILKDTVKKPLH